MSIECIEVEVRARDPAVQAQPLGLGGQRLDVAGERVVGLVAVQVDHEAAARRELAQGRTEAAPSSIVRSKCGMPPTTSTPMSSARSRFAAAPGER